MATRPKSPRVIAAELVIAQLRQEAHAARHRCDDDVPSVPEASPLDSAQSRRANR